MLDWGGPTTSQLTNQIRKTGFKIKNSPQKVTDYLYQTLHKNGFKESEVNFETIINVIEELSIFFSEFNPKTQSPSLLRVFLNGEAIKEVFDFTIKGGSEKDGHSIPPPPV